MDAVADRGDVDAQHFGVWGANLGAYVALSEAARDPRVRAVAAESPYNHPAEMAGLLANRMGLASLPFITGMVKIGFGWMNSDYRNVPPLRLRIQKLTGVAQLYLQTQEEPVLAASTRELFQVSPVPHELVNLDHGNYAGMLDDEKRDYENRIVSFFLVNLSPAGGQ